VSLSFGFLSTYPPTQCGLATFTAALRARLVAGGSRAGVVRVLDRPETPSSSDVLHHLVPGSSSAQAEAADALNDFDVVIVQHEFGIYGGPDGDEVLGVVDRLTVPFIVVAHTVLTPSSHQREVLERLVERADAVVTMTRTAHDRLVARHDVDPTKIVVIPRRGGRARHTQPPARTGLRRFTWGLIGPGKGIESVIDVLPRLRSLDRPPLYRVVGQTHPRVLERQGEAYRDALVARAEARGVTDMLRFEAGYLDIASLNRVVAEADVVVLPYESREQVTSGVLIEAVAAGKPVVATAFPHAIELLAAGAGLVVAHDDPDALACALHRVLAEPALAASMTDRSGRVAPQLMWSSVAARYSHSPPAEHGQSQIGGVMVHDPPFDHVLRLSDERGSSSTPTARRHDTSIVTASMMWRGLVVVCRQRR
jgi:glycosyltransferase involved in cell wall biosynthesis